VLLTIINCLIPIAKMANTAAVDADSSAAAKLEIWKRILKGTGHKACLKGEDYAS
jgi:hypothetical protein